MYSFDKAPDVKKGLIGVYAIFVASNPTVAYIGSSKCIRTRLMYHLNKLKKGNHKNWRMKSLWSRYEDEFRWKIIKVLTTENEARSTEQFLLDVTPKHLLLNVDFKVYNYKRK